MPDNDPKVALTAGLAKVLHKLATDNDFRARFQQDPRGTLAQHGIQVAPEQVPGQVKVPSKRELTRSFDQYLDNIAPGLLGVFPFPIFTPHRPKLPRLKRQRSKSQKP